MGIVYIIEKKQKEQNQSQFEKFFSYQYAIMKFNELKKVDYDYVLLYKSEVMESTL